jgi:mono/diheme cytochrome c family protein
MGLRTVTLIPFFAFVAAAAAQPQQERGQTLFTEHCAVCHGALGDGGSAPDLANPGWQTSITDAELDRIIREGVRGAAMPAFADRLDQDARQAVVQHLRWLGNQALQPVTSIKAPKLNVSGERLLNSVRDPDNWLMWGGN